MDVGRALDDREIRPQLIPALLAARQQKERFDFTWLNVVHVPVFVLSTAALPVLVWLAGTRDRRPAACLALFVLFALLGNAAICGMFASPHDRYQSRLAPLAPLVVAIAMLGWRRDRVAPATPSDETALPGRANSPMTRHRRIANRFVWSRPRPLGRARKWSGK
jgi:hypothetical protein